jgi:hypothetical protein
MQFRKRFFVISTSILFLTSAHAAQSPWSIKIVGAGCNVNNPSVSDCSSAAWVYNKDSGELFFCNGSQHSAGAPPGPQHS